MVTFIIVVAALAAIGWFLLRKLAKSNNPELAAAATKAEEAVENAVEEVEDKVEEVVEEVKTAVKKATRKKKS